MQLFQINQSEEISKITINVHTSSCPLHELPITTASALYVMLDLVLEAELAADGGDVQSVLVTHEHEVVAAQVACHVL